MTRRLAQFTTGNRDDTATLIRSEHVGSHLVTLPRSSARHRAALLTYAVEDRIATPISRVRVVQGPLSDAPVGQFLAFVISMAVLDAFPEKAGRLIPEFLLIPRPKGPDGWAVWRDGARVIVRCADGTGFAAPTDTLAMLWARAGRPPLTSFGMALPGNLSATDQSDNPPPPDPADLVFAIPRKGQAQKSNVRTGLFVGSAIAAALVLHVAVAGLDAVALAKQAAVARTDAQAAIDARLPGITLTPDVGPILARLSPQVAQIERGSFLPLLSDVTAVMATLESPPAFRRLAWGGAENTLVVLVQADGLDDLQRLQQALETASFSVRSGAANASDGGAEAELRISRGGS